MTNQNRLSRLLADLAGQGVSFTVSGGRVVIVGMDSEPWLDDWLERNHSELLALLGCPDGHEATRTPIPLPEDARPRYNDLSAPSATRPTRSELAARLASIKLD